LKTGGIIETLPDDDFPGREEIIAGIRQAALLNWKATLADVGNVAAFVASNQGCTLPKQRDLVVTRAFDAPLE
jgi:3-oxoacyl-[acyl-carrier protein] reductase